MWSNLKKCKNKKNQKEISSGDNIKFGAKVKEQNLMKQNTNFIF